MHSANLSNHLQSQFDYEIVDLIDLDELITQSRNTLYTKFKYCYKPVFKDNERIVLYSRNPISFEILEHLQRCATLVDISNFFILICSPGVESQQIEKVRALYSTDDVGFQFLQINFLDTVSEKLPEKNSLLSLPETFCFSPWAQLEISSRGEFKPCCVYKESIKDDKNQPYNINTHSITEVYNSKYLIDLRREFLSGRKPNGCSNCWEKEKAFGKSNRTWLTDYLGIDAHCLEIEKENLLDNLITLDIKLGNLCNFKCRICDENNSSRIAEEKFKYFDSTLDIKTINANGNWANNEHVWKLFKQHSAKLTNIDFYGGEPFLIRQQFVFLDYLIEQGSCNRIRLHYNSNGSIYPENFFNRWKNFREVDIAFSIDNIGSRFEFERGGKWKEVETNLDRMLETRLSNMTLSVFVTVNVQNIYYLDQILDWYESKKFDWIKFSLLENPIFLNISSMDRDLTQLVIEKLSQINEARRNKYNINLLIDKLKNNKCSTEHLDQLAKFMLDLDKVRNQNFYYSHREIADIIYKKGKKHGETI